MKAKIKLLPATLGMITDAMKTYSDTLTGFKKRQFDIAYKKIIESNGEAYLDGMEIEYVCIALRKCGWLYMRLHRKDKAEPYFELAQWMKERKMEFQQTYGPKVGKPRFEVLA
jgi:hypothetical protein